MLIHRKVFGVSEGARTLNHFLHKEVLCQLSYTHHNSCALGRNRTYILGLEVPYSIR